MNIFLYKDRHKETQSWCEVCSNDVGRKNLDPHHIYGAKYGDECILVCRDCHMKIENPSAFTDDFGNKLPTSWAYDNGYKIRRGKDTGTKVKKNKQCKHGAYIFDKEQGEMVCQWCRKIVKGASILQTKKKKTVTKKVKKCEHTVTMYDSSVGDFVCSFCKKIVGELRTGKSKKHDTISKKKPGTKMGFEQVDPRISQAEKLKTQYNVLTKRLKMTGLPLEEYQDLHQKRRAVKNQMRQLQQTYEE